MNYSQLVQDVIDGVESPLKAYGVIQEHLKQIKEAAEVIKEIALEEATKYPEKKFDEAGFTFEYKEGRKIWNFKNISEWSHIKAQLTDVEKRAKGAFSNYQNGVLSVSQDGEEIELPEVTYTKPSLTVRNNG